MQARIFGGAVGLSIASAVLNNHLSANLSVVDSQALQADPATYISRLPDSAQHAIKKVFGEGYSIGFKIMTGFAAAQVLSLMLMYRKPQVSMAPPATKKQKQAAEVQVAA